MSIVSLLVCIEWCRRTCIVNIVPAHWQTTPVLNVHYSLDVREYRGQACFFSGNRYADPEAKAKHGEHVRKCHAGPRREDGDGEKLKNRSRMVNPLRGALLLLIILISDREGQGVLDRRHDVSSPPLSSAVDWHAWYTLSGESLP